MAVTAARWPWGLLCLAAAPLLFPAVGGLSCCYHAKDNLMCRDVCEQILSSKSDSRLKHLLQRAPEYCPESMGEVWGCINSSLPGVLKKSDGWVGLGCCELAIAVECRQACKQHRSSSVRASDLAAVLSYHYCTWQMELIHFLSASSRHVIIADVL